MQQKEAIDQNKNNPQIIRSHIKLLASVLNIPEDEVTAALLIKRAVAHNSENELTRT